jgi:hypothetical protein
VEAKNILMRKVIFGQPNTYPQQSTSVNLQQAKKQLYAKRVSY